jgi:cytochrome c oxidase subunit 2
MARTENYLLEVDNPVVVPVNKKVRLVLTANDVIHSWTIPAFAVKQDAIPGFVRDTWFRPRRSAPTAAIASNCAARSTLSCRSS